MKPKTSIIIKLPGGREMEYKENADKNFDIMFDTMRAVIADRSAEIVNNGPFVLEENRDKVTRTKGFSTFIMFKVWGEPLDTGSDAFWQEMDKIAAEVNFPDLVEKTYTYQLVWLYVFDPDESKFVDIAKILK